MCHTETSVPTVCERIPLGTLHGMTTNTKPSYECSISRSLKLLCERLHVCQVQIRFVSHRVPISKRLGKSSYSHLLYSHLLYCTLIKEYTHKHTNTSTQIHKYTNSMPIKFMSLNQEFIDTVTQLGYYGEVMKIEEYILTCKT